MTQWFEPQFLELSFCHLDSTLSISLFLLVATSLFSIRSYTKTTKTSMKLLIKSVRTFTELESIVADDRLFVLQKHWITCNSIVLEIGSEDVTILFGCSVGLGVSKESALGCFGGSICFSLLIGGLARLPTVFHVTKFYLT